MPKILSARIESGIHERFSSNYLSKQKDARLSDLEFETNLMSHPVRMLRSNLRPFW